MKHFLLIITLFTSLCAAAIEPIVSESKEWYHYRTTYIDGNLISRDSLYSYVFDGVEEVNGVEYHKLIINDNEPYNTSILMRQDGGKTLLLTGSVINIDGFSEEFEKEFPDYDHSEITLFDFDAEPGTKYLSVCQDGGILAYCLNEIESVSEVTINGVKRRRQKVKSHYYSSDNDGV